MPERTTIKGIRLRCESCKTVFAIGSNGIEPTRARIMEHSKECFGGLDIRPVDTPFSRPKGLTYSGIINGGIETVVYGGKDWDEFWNKVMAASRAFVTVMSPVWELTTTKEV